MHKASKLVIDKCAKREINTIVIGKNDGWKQESKLSKKVNQHFVQIPFAKLIEMIKYKMKIISENFKEREVFLLSL